MLPETKGILKRKKLQIVIRLCCNTANKTSVLHLSGSCGSYISKLRIKKSVLKFFFLILQSKTLDIKISFTTDITPLSSNASLLSATHFSHP